MVLMIENLFLINHKELNLEKNIELVKELRFSYVLEGTIP